MSWGVLGKLFGRRHSDQWAYEAAAEEIRSGRKRDGLMLKATSLAGGDRSKAEALYGKLLAEEIADESSRETINSASKTAYRAAVPVAKATSSWLISVALASFAGLILAAIGGYHGLAEISRIEGWKFADYSAGTLFGRALMYAIVVELIVIATACVLMLFPRMRTEKGGQACLIIAGLLSLWAISNLLRDAKIAKEMLQNTGIGNSANIVPSLSPAPNPVVRQPDVAYSNALAQLEQQYPQINPDSPLFNKAATDRIAARMQQRMQSGLRKEDSLRASVSEEFGQQQATRQPAAMPAFKPQMGAAPSASIPEHCRQIFIQATNSAPEDTPIAEYARIRDRAEDAMNRCAKRR